MEYSTLIRPQFEMVGVTAGILRGSASQRSSSEPAVMARPASEANLDLRTRVLPPAEKVCVWQSTASGTTRRLERLEKDASNRTNSPEGGNGQLLIVNGIPVLFRPFTWAISFSVRAYTHGDLTGRAHAATDRLVGLGVNGGLSVCIAIQL